MTHQLGLIILWLTLCVCLTLPLPQLGVWYETGDWLNGVLKAIHCIGLGSDQTDHLVNNAGDDNRLGVHILIPAADSVSVQ